MTTFTTTITAMYTLPQVDGETDVVVNADSMVTPPVSPSSQALPWVA